MFGDLRETLGENNQLAHQQSDLAESLVMSKAPSTSHKYQPLVSKWELFCYQARRLLAGLVIKKKPVEKKEVVSMPVFTVPDFNDINLDSADNALAVPKAITL